MLDTVAGTRESVMDKAEILLSWSLREDKHINYNYQKGQSAMINIFVRAETTFVFCVLIIYYSSWNRGSTK